MRLWRRRVSANGRERAAAIPPVAPPVTVPAKPTPQGVNSGVERGGFSRAVRRFLVVQVLMLWQGGFLFYTAVVVPTGTEVLGSAAAQGAITARVTDALNLLGVVGIAIVAWDLAVTRDPSRRRTAARWCCWAAAMVCQYLLLVFHPILISLMDPGRMYVTIREPFYPLHRLYLWASTVQWLAGVLLVWWTLRAWSQEQPASITGPGC